MEKPDETARQQIQSDTTQLTEEISFVRGGPFYRAQEAVHLLTPRRWNLGRRIPLAIVVGWVPLVSLTLLTKPDMIGDLLRDYTVNFRMLVAVPVLLIGQIVMENVFRMIIGHLHKANILASREQAQMDFTISRLLRLRDSVLAEVIIVVIAYASVATLASVRLEGAPGWAVGDLGRHHLSAAGWYYSLASQLIYRLLLCISIWKWILWVCLLFRLSRLDLQLVPTHPDQHGGIAFLGMSPLAIAPTVFVACGAIGSTWRTQILDHGARLTSFKFDAIVLLAIMLIAAMGPLFLFVPKLAVLYRQGVLEYGTLGQLHSAEFHKKWIENRAGHEEEFLSAPEVSTLTDYKSSYEHVENLQLFPLDRRTVVVLVLAIVVPLLPVVLAEIPFITVVKGLIGAVK